MRLLAIQAPQSPLLQPAYLESKFTQIQSCQCLSSELKGSTSSPVPEGHLLWRRYYDPDYLSGRWRNTGEPRLSHVTPPFQYQSQIPTSSALLWIFQKGLAKAWMWPLSPIQQHKRNQTEKISTRSFTPYPMKFPWPYLISPFWDFSFPTCTMVLSCSR